MTYQSPRSPQFDPYRGGTNAASAGRTIHISRYLFPLVLIGAPVLAYLNPSETAALFGIEPAGAAADELVRNGALVVGGVVLFIMVLATIARTRKARQEGIPRH